MVSDILQEAGYTVETASNGAEIISKVTSFLPNLLVLDLQLPDMNGFEVVKRIRGGEVLPHLPILAMSAVYTDSSHVMALDDVGANDYISKKFKPDHLLGRISKILEREASTGEA
jgi:DNA-binding response OmpR family regulator